jgi:hypothetical protein
VQIRRIEDDAIELAASDFISSRSERDPRTVTFTVGGGGVISARWALSGGVEATTSTWSVRCASCALWTNA